MTTTTVTRKPKPEITAAAIYRVNDKQGQCLGYLVPSDQEGTDPYRITFNFEAHRYECSCKCGVETDHAVTCKHIRAVNSTVAARKEIMKEQLTPAPIVETPQPDGTTRVETESGKHIATIRRVQPEVIPVEEQAEHQDNGLDAAVAEYLRHTSADAYEVLAPTKAVVSNVCGHLVKHDANRHCGCMA